MFDKPCLVRFTRGAGGLFGLAETVKVESGGKEAEGGAAAKTVTLHCSQAGKDSPQERCPRGARYAVL
jgi:hypothetical protein